MPCLRAGLPWLSHPTAGSAAPRCAGPLPGSQPWITDSARPAPPSLHPLPAGEDWGAEYDGMPTPHDHELVAPFCLPEYHPVTPDGEPYQASRGRGELGESGQGAWEGELYQASRGRGEWGQGTAEGGAGQERAQGRRSARAARSGLGCSPSTVGRGAGGALPHRLARGGRGLAGSGCGRHHLPSARPSTPTYQHSSPCCRPCLQMFKGAFSILR